MSQEDESGIKKPNREEKHRGSHALSSENDLLDIRSRKARMGSDYMAAAQEDEKWENVLFQSASQDEI